MSKVLAKVGNFLYNLHASTFTDLSDIFAQVYTLPQGNTTEGKSDENPFVLEGIDSGEFTYLLEYMYHKLRSLYLIYFFLLTFS